MLWLLDSSPTNSWPTFGQYRPPLPRDAKLGEARASPSQMLAQQHSPLQYFEIGDKILEARTLKFGAGGSVLENFGQIFEKLWPTNATKAYLLILKNFPDAPHKRVI